MITSFLSCKVSFDIKFVPKLFFLDINYICVWPNFSQSARNLGITKFFSIFTFA